MEKKRNLLKAVMPLMLLGTPAIAGSSVLAGSKLRTKNTVVKSEKLSTQNLEKKESYINPFASFSEENEIVTKTSKEDIDVLAFLSDEGLLNTTSQENSVVSGASIMSKTRKSFTSHSSSYSSYYASVNLEVFDLDILSNNNNFKVGREEAGSINIFGNLNQLMYNYEGDWTHLDYFGYGLDFAFGIGGDGTNEWNINGTILDSKGDYVAEYSLINHILDKSGFTIVDGKTGFGTIISRGDILIDGKLIGVERTYELQEDTNVIKIITKLINNTTESIANVRVWVGIKDNYLEKNDEPTQVRGNLSKGVFTPIESKTESSNAIEILSTNLRAFLFGRNSEGTMNNSLGFQNVIGTNPLEAEILLGSLENPSDGEDSSYGLYTRLDDLEANGGSREFVSYFALGTHAEIEDALGAVALPEAAINAGAYNFTDRTARISFKDMSDNEDGFRFEHVQNSNAVLTTHIPIETNLFNRYEYVNLTGLIPNTLYTINIIPFNANGDAPALTKSFRTLETPNTPLQPNSLGAYTFTDSSVRISFKDMSDNEDGFKVYYDGTVLATIPANDIREEFVYQTITGLSTCTLYTLNLVAYNADGESEALDKSFMTTGCMTEADIPLAPSNVGVYNIKSDSVRVSFLDNANNEQVSNGFVIYNNEDNTTMAQLSRNRYTHEYQYANLLNLTPDTLYTIRVVAKNSAGEGSTELKSFHTLAID